MWRAPAWSRRRGCGCARPSSRRARACRCHSGGSQPGLVYTGVIKCLLVLFSCFPPHIIMADLI